MGSSSYEMQAAYASSQATKTKVTSTAQECSNWITEADISDSQKEIYLNNLSRNTHGSMPSRSLDELSKDTSLHLSSSAVESMQVVEGAQVSCMKGMTRDMLVSTSSGGPKVGGKPGLTIKDTETVLGTFGTCKKQTKDAEKKAKNEGKDAPDPVPCEPDFEDEWYNGDVATKFVDEGALHKLCMLTCKHAGEKGSVIIETNGQGSSADIMLQTMDLMAELFLSDAYQFFTGRNFNTYGKLTIGERAFSGFMMALDFVPFGKVVDVLKLGKYTDEAMDLMRRYGDNFTDLMRKYGDEFSEMLGKYSEEMLELAGIPSSYLDDAARYGDDLVISASKHGDEAASAGKKASGANNLGNPVDVVGKGNTGRFEPDNLIEQIAMSEVQSNPLKNATELPFKMSDTRWPSDDGWVKMQNNVTLSNGDKISIHYVYNKVTGLFDDFKFK
ncbi:DUF4280 domain-containing protein [Enterococcus sp. BWB1-3]|uniref:PAAR-like protein n=1 Tax=Enterococcus sp. BWB1-3 TaxID=2787713 RepID=UPI001924900C|nr:PAAR-like protein [Enterococcus sp. BWB1-3]MBL1230535.1 DUF4280 domain-containing protein [Enterococcus sp. BWB1-3]